MKIYNIFNNKLNLAIVLLILTANAVQGIESKEIIFNDIGLRNGITSDIHLKVFTNEKRSEGETIFAIAGWAHTANSWEPFAKALFDDNKNNIYKVIAIDMPGQGDSTIYPTNAFETLTLYDYVYTTLTVLDLLKRDNQNKELKTIIGHSQGGLVIQMMQQALKEKGLGLNKFGIKNVILLASATPREIDVSYRNNIDVVAFANAFLIDGYSEYYPELEREMVEKYGYHFYLPNEFWRQFFYIKYNDGTVSSKAPSIDQVEKYNTRAPLSTTSQLIGLKIIGSPDPYYPYWKEDDILLDNSIRPSIDRGIFKDKIELNIVSYTQDTLVRPDENHLLYKYLTGKDNEDEDENFVVIEGDNLHDSVHDLHISDPGYLIKNIRDLIP